MQVVEHTLSPIYDKNSKGAESYMDLADEVIYKNR